MKKARQKESIGIAECAKLTGLTARALRVYEREGLIKPIRSANGWRLYTKEHLVRLNEIVALKGLGFTLAQIRQALSSSLPSLRGVLHLQLDVWQKRKVASEEGIKLVHATLASLDAREHLSIDDLCQLARKIEMTIPQETMREVINNTISAEEEREWMIWWSRRPQADSETMQQYSAAQRVVMSEFAKLRAAGASPASEDAQHLLVQWIANLTHFRARELMLEMMNWNTPLTRKWLTVGDRVIEKTATPGDSTSESIWHFFGATFKASSLGSSLDKLLEEVRTAGLGDTPQQSDAFAQRFLGLCHDYDLGNPVVYVRWRCAMGTLSDTGERIDLAPADRAAWDYLAECLSRSH